MLSCQIHQEIFQNVCKDRKRVKWFTVKPTSTKKDLNQKMNKKLTHISAAIERKQRNHQILMKHIFRHVGFLYKGKSKPFNCEFALETLIMHVMSDLRVLITKNQTSRGVN